MSKRAKATGGRKATAKATAGKTPTPGGGGKGGKKATGKTGKTGKRAKKT